MYCPECGHKIEEDSMRFCPECGTRLDEPTARPEKRPADEGGGSSAKAVPIHAYGLIFTNVSLLARKFRCAPDTVAGLLDTFIEYRKCSGICYRLVDAGNYSFSRSGLFSRNRTASLDSSSPVEDYLEILMDVHEKEEKKGGAVSEYLFIIGGADIIPMPRIRHYFAENSSDKTIDTDLLYAYPYNSEMVSALEDMEAFGYDQMFHVGRLPLGQDAVIEDLAGYLQRVLDCSGTISIGQSYGQCDPNWKDVSATVASPLIGGGCMRDFDGRLDEEYYYNKMILSPMITRDTVGQVLHTGADLYYFNLHGGEGAESRGYFGVSTPQQGGELYSAILPEHLMALENRNIVISEACYGGKFIGLDKRRSMLLASLFTNTLSFVGSSRIAYGSVDTADTSGESQLFAADIIAYMFMLSAMNGYDAGQSMFMARSALLRSGGWGDVYTALTITEFNLYGDPALLMFSPSGGGKASFKTAGKAPLAPKGSKKDICRIEKIGGENRTGPILRQVRSAVDANIMDMHDKIARYLYSNYSIEPRKPDNIFRLRYESGKEEILFNYKVSTGTGGMEMQYTVNAAPDGKIQKVFTTK